MRRLEIPRGSMGRTLEKLINAKRGARRGLLQALLPYVKTRYALYLQNRRSLENVVALNWDDEEKEAFLHCYGTESTTLVEVKKSVFECLGGDEMALCPYCLLRSPQHIDHFLPAARFPEFSTLRVNLVWVCGSCNGVKGDSFTNAPRAVLNPYFDQIPADTPILYCKVEVRNGDLKIEFRIPTNVDQVDANLILLAQRHCATFSLYRAYAAEASALMSSWLRELAARFPGGLSADTLANEISYQMARASGREPANSWYSAMWFGVLHCAEIHPYVSAFIASQPAPPVTPPRIRNKHLLNWF